MVIEVRAGYVLRCGVPPASFIGRCAADKATVSAAVDQRAAVNGSPIRQTRGVGYAWGSATVTRDFPRPRFWSVALSRSSTLLTMHPANAERQDRGIEGDGEANLFRNGHGCWSPRGSKFSYHLLPIQKPQNDIFRAPQEFLRSAGVFA